MMLQEELEEMEAERAAKERHLQMSQKAVPWVETQFFAMLMAAVVLANSVVIGCPDFGTWDEGEKQKKVGYLVIPVDVYKKWESISWVR
ncbi:unnamed protein product [Durusdinium trenchii]|uniref:PGG domain-containing protein n=1 Tax=Durusdinium trenchii TaxID=1381693 RepID=A0ABP0P752_9DINO